MMRRLGSSVEGRWVRTIGGKIAFLFPSRGSAPQARFRGGSHAGVVYMEVEPSSSQRSRERRAGARRRSTSDRPWLPPRRRFPTSCSNPARAATAAMSASVLPSTSFSFCVPTVTRRASGARTRPIGRTITPRRSNASFAAAASPSADEEKSATAGPGRLESVLAEHVLQQAHRVSVWRRRRSSSSGAEGSRRQPPGR